MEENALAVILWKGGPAEYFCKVYLIGSVFFFRIPPSHRLSVVNLSGKEATGIP